MRTMIGTVRRALTIAIVAALAGCSGLRDGPTAEPSVIGTTAAAPSAAASPSAGDGVRAGHVRVLGLWSGPELDSFNAVKSAWEQQTGGTVDWEGTNNVPGALAEHPAAGTSPDIAILPNVAEMQQLASAGKLVQLESVLDPAALATDYTPAWIDLGSVDGSLYGIPYKVTNKSTVWYDPKAFAAAGYTVPTTWDEMTALADRIVADGRTPFSIVAARGPASGWALTDWISEIVLNKCGAEVYDRWIAAAIPWTDACIKGSFDLFAAVVSTKGYVLGGSERILSTGDDVAADPLYMNPPSAYLCYLASFAQAFIAANHPGLEPGTDYDVFPFPTIAPRNAGAVTVGADVPVMVTDTPAARSFMAYLAGAPAQEMWVKRGGFTSVNRSVSPTAYADPVARRIAADLASAKVSRFSAGDLMPATVQRAWWGAMLDFVKDPGSEKDILERLTAVAKSAT